MGNTVLVADDDANDQFFIGRELRKLVPPVHLQFVENGEQAIAYLQGTGVFSDRPRSPIPSVIFIDLKMPKVNGFELLEWLRRHETFKVIPTVVLSSSILQSDVDKAYELGANAYLVKPATVAEFQKLFKATGEFFLEHARTPSLRLQA